MYLEELVEVAIGLIFAWLVLSIATMQVQEFIATKILNKRANDLKLAIGNMLNDPEKLEEFYKHPLISSLAEPARGVKNWFKKELQENIKTYYEQNNKEQNWFDKWLNTWAAKPTIPSYIPAENFAAALFDLVANAGTEKSTIHKTFEKLRKETKDEDIVDNILKLGKLIANTKESNQFQEEIKKTLNKQIKLLGKNYKDNKVVQDLANHLSTAINQKDADLKKLFESDQVLEQVRNGAQALGANHTLSKSLNSLLAGVEECATNADKALALGRTNVEQWFDNIMERMKGWYKRWAQTWAFVIGLLLAVIFNVDSIHLATTLWREPELRRAYSSYIESFVKENEDSAEKIGEANLDAVKTKLEELEIPLGWETMTYTGTKKCSIPANEDQVIGYYLPFSDQDPEKAGIQAPCIQILDAPRNYNEIFLKTLGIFISALAAMQGAPFWFDILKKLVNVRNTGSNPAEKPKEEATETA